MPTRRTLLLSLPLLSLPSALRAAPAWRRDVSELRFGASGSDVAALSGSLHHRLGVAVRPVHAQGGALARELDRGHVEFALVDRATLSAARARMHRRLVVGPARPDGRTLVMRSVLPPAMRHDLAAAFA